jgi:hypothetical protein
VWEISEELKNGLKTISPLYQITEIFKNVNFPQLMKGILNMFSIFGGPNQHLVG